MTGARLRRAEGLRPYARAKPRAASRLAGARYPFGELADYLQSTMKITATSSHHELEHVATCATAEALENLFVRMNVERGATFGVQWAQPN